MKTVQAHVISSDPISLSDATSFLSSFSTSVFSAASSGSHETSWFVRRALASFEELDRKLSGTHNPPPQQQSFVSSRDVVSLSKPGSPRHDDLSDTKAGEVKKEKKNMKKKKERQNNVDDNVGGIKEEENSEMRSEAVKKEEKKKKRKRKSEVLENGKGDAAVEEQSEKKKKS